MFKLCIFFAILAFAMAATIGSRDNQITTTNSTTSKPFIAILNSMAAKKSDGSFIFTYEGEDGSFRAELGIVQNAGTDDETLEVSGTYRYIDADGKHIEVRYTAGKEGFVPHGTNIIPEIALAAKLAAEASRQQNTEQK